MRRHPSDSGWYLQKVDTRSPPQDRTGAGGGQDCTKMVQRMGWETHLAAQPVEIAQHHVIIREQICPYQGVDLLHGHPALLLRPAALGRTDRTHDASVTRTDPEYDTLLKCTHAYSRAEQRVRYTLPCTETGTHAGSLRLLHNACGMYPYDRSGTDHTPCTMHKIMQADLQTNGGTGSSRRPLSLSATRPIPETTVEGFGTFTSSNRR